MKIVVKIPVKIKPRQGPLRPQTGAGVHKKDKGYQRNPKHKGRIND